MHLAATFKTCARNAIDVPLPPRLTPVLSPPPFTLLPYHFNIATASFIGPAAPHIITMQIRLACGKARVKSSSTLPTCALLSASFPLPLSCIRLPFLVHHLPASLPPPSPGPLAPTSHQLASHICKTCHYYNNITPMNLPLNMRSTSVDCIANYLPGGGIRTRISFAISRNTLAPTGTFVSLFRVLSA